METKRKRKGQYDSIPKRLAKCEQVLKGVSSPDLLALVGPYITAESLAPGLAQLQEMKALERQQRKLRRQTKAANQKFLQEYEGCHKALSATRKLTKVLGRHHPEVLHDLGLNSRLPRQQMAWVLVALEFYEDALGRADLLAVVEAKGLPRARLEAEWAKVQTLKPLRQKSVALDATKQQSTQDRNASLAGLEDTCKEILALAELALNEQGKPQLLERLGKIVK